jgi:hypothetical protein
MSKEPIMKTILAANVNKRVQGMICHLLLRQGVVRPNFTWSKLSFFSWSKVSFSVDQIFWDFSVDRKIWSSAKKEPTDFGSWLKLFKSLKCHY